LGKSRDHNENSALEVGFGSNNGGFMIKSYNDMHAQGDFFWDNEGSGRYL
jgi:hypothetical protein